jgi:hypothetical protein
MLVKSRAAVRSHSSPCHPLVVSHSQPRNTNAVWKLKYDYAKLIFYHVVESTLAAQPPSYTTILDLDRKVREMSFPTSLKPYLSREDGDEMYYNTSLSVRDFYASQYRTVSKLSI